MYKISILTSVKIVLVQDIIKQDTTFHWLSRVNHLNKHRSPCYVWLADLRFNVSPIYQQLRSYGDGTSICILIRHLKSLCTFKHAKLGINLISVPEEGFFFFSFFPIFFFLP